MDENNNLYGQEIFPGVVVYENFLTNPEDLLEMFKEDSNWRHAEVETESYNSETIFQGVNKNIRNTKVLDLQLPYRVRNEYFLISQAIYQCADAYANNYGIYFTSMENPQVLHYDTGEGFYEPHMDASAANARVFSSLLYLNNVDEGGETYFNRIDLSIKPQAGTLIMFPANYVYLHEARPPISNDKFALVTWFNQRA